MGLSFVIVWFALSVGWCESLTRRRPIFGHKKGPVRSLFSRMGAFAGWLHHPAHAPSYHDENHCDFHDIAGSQNRYLVNADGLQARLLQP
jgi:hypothetical protein